MFSPTLSSPTLFFTEYKNKFLPNRIAGLQLWLDSSDTSSITSSGGEVSQWNDKSGNGNHAVQATAGEQPFTGETTINGKNVITFHGAASSEWMKILSMSCTPNTVAIVFRNNTATFSDYNSILCARSSLSTKVANSTNPSGTSGIISTAKISAITQVTTAAYLDGTAVSSTDFDSFSVGITISPATSTHLILYTDNVGAGTQNYAIGTDTFGAVGTRHFEGDIAEIVIYNHEVSVISRSLLTTYLKNKWGIA